MFTIREALIKMKKSRQFNEVWEALKDCPLFSGISESEMVKLMNNIDNRIQKFEKHSVIAMEGNECREIGIVLW